MYLHEALYNIHFPENPDMLRKALFRLKFEELFYIQLNILKLKYKRKTYFKGHEFKTIGEYFNTFYHRYLPFELTDAHKRVIKEIRQDCGDVYADGTGQLLPDLSDGSHRDSGHPTL